MRRFKNNEIVFSKEFMSDVKVIKTDDDGQRTQIEIDNSWVWTTTDTLEIIKQLPIFLKLLRSLISLFKKKII